MMSNNDSPDELEAADGLYSLQFSRDSINNEEENKNVTEDSKIVKKTYSPDVIQGAKDLYSLSIKPATYNNGEPEISKAPLIKKLKVVIKTPQAVIKKQPAIKESKVVMEKTRKKRKIVEEDDTEETLQLLLQRIKNGEGEIPPPDMIVSKIPNAVTVEFSRCVYKQLTESDVKVDQSRLMLGKKEVKDKFLCLLEESEIPGVEGVDVSVYGPDGESNEMKFKMWNKDTPVLMNGWSNFVKAYGLQKYSDVLKIWMFRSSEDRKICFVIDSIRFDGITNQLSRSILNNVFQN